MEKGVILEVPEQKVLETAKTILTIAKTKEKLAQYGMDAVYFSTFEADIANASGFKTDEELKKELESFTKLKNDKLAEAGKWGDEVKIRLELAYADNPSAAKEFPVNFSKAKKSETLMLEVIPNINNLIDKHAVKLKEKGLPDDHKQKGLDLKQQIDDANTSQETMKKNRPQYTQERVAAYVKLYDKVNDINKTGRTAYANSAADLQVFKSPWPVSKKKDSNDINTKTDTETKTETKTETTK
jgi:hypothetical protein